jgi:hypothetical protein
MSNITPAHVRVFQAVRSQLYDNITLASCTINDEPGVVIVMVDHAGENKVAVMPLFVAIMPSMKIDFPGQGDWEAEDEWQPETAQQEVTKKPPRR